MGCYYTSPQSYIKTFSNSLALQLWGLSLNLIGWIIKLSVQRFQPPIVIYSKGNFMYLYWEWHEFIGHCLMPLDPWLMSACINHTNMLWNLFKCCKYTISPLAFTGFRLYNDPSTQLIGSIKPWKIPLLAKIIEFIKIENKTIKYFIDDTIQTYIFKLLKKLKIEINSIFNKDINIYNTKSKIRIWTLIS